MILAETETDRRRALAKILPMQRQDFVDLFSIMEGRPVTIRLLDPPLHEFLPRTDAEMEETAKQAGVSVATIRARAHDLHEFNPMLGHRGCRLGISYPEIYEMQARAIFEAMLAMQEDRNQAVVPEIMIPLVGSRRELDILKHHIDGVANELGIAPDRGAYIIGTMIELPRAALMAGDIAETAEFFSFGTNDLTQTTFGLSRDDSGAFLEDYIRGGIFARDPFVSIDKDGVGQLVELAAERGKSARADIKLGICGEHGGDPASIAFCESIGLDYVSCSPYRVPIARLSAAQAALQANEDAAS
jgi:pyruvate,orthophosphate dikinase